MLIFIMRIDICHINFQPTLFFYFLFFIKWNINVGDCFTLCYFCLITNVQCLVGSLHEELGEGMGSSTHINSNCDAHRWQNDNGTWHMGKLAFFFFFFFSSSSQLPQGAFWRFPTGNMYGNSLWERLRFVLHREIHCHRERWDREKWGHI